MASNSNKRETWLAYWISYLRQMQKTKDPWLASSNYHADKFRETHSTNRN